jgi:hypothetical protein
MITVDSSGNVALAAGGSTTSASSTIEAGTLTLTSYVLNGNPHFDGIDFAAGITSPTVNDIYLGYNGFIGMKTGVTFRDLGLGSISSVTSVPDPATSAYSNYTSVISLQNGANDGRLYAIRLPTDRYAVIEIVTSQIMATTTVTIRYKYHPDNNSRQF